MHCLIHILLWQNRNLNISLGHISGCPNVTGDLKGGFALPGCTRSNLQWVREDWWRNRVRFEVGETDINGFKDWKINCSLWSQKTTQSGVRLPCNSATCHIAEQQNTTLYMVILLNPLSRTLFKLLKGIENLCKYDNECPNKLFHHS